MREETKDINGFKITLPVGWSYDPKANRDDYASYITEERGWREIMHHLHALTTVLAPAVRLIGDRYSRPLKVLHAFGGLGATAQVIQQVTNSEHTFWERSVDCVKYLEGKWKDVHLVEDSLKEMGGVDLSKYNIIIFDPSLGTILSPGIMTAWDALGAYDTQLIWVSDFATSKLHLNGKAYARAFDGLETPTPELYAEGYDQFLRKRGKRIVNAIRDSFEMYFVITPNKVKNGKMPTFPRPIPKMT